MIGDVGQIVLLAGHGAEMREGGFQAGVDLGLAEHAQARRGDLRVRFGDRRVAHDRAGEPTVACQRGGDDRDHAAHRVADDHRRAGEVGGVGDGHDLAGPLFDRIGRPVVAVAVSGQVEGGDAVVVREQGRDVGPPVVVRTAAVDEHESGPARLPPGAERDGGAVDLDGVRLGRHGERVAEPVRGLERFSGPRPDQVVSRR